MARRIDVTCCIAGGGPAGLMLGFLLARAGIEVLVLEKHEDFLRDFRGDTIHPSTMQVMAELGLVDDFLKLPHEKVRQVTARFGDETVVMADFSGLPVAAPFIAMMPQWDFLDFLADRGRAYPGFRLMMATEATGLVLDAAGRVVGVRGRAPDGEVEIHAALTVAADGRGSTLRREAGMAVEDFGAPMDVLWFRLSRRPEDTAETQGRFDAGRIFIMLNRGDYWQCAFVIPKGADAAVRAAGLEAFQKGLAPLLPFEAGRAAELDDWGKVKLLTVQVNRLKTWFKPGLLFIGDAAHAMSPVAGVGVNLAVQDAVAAARLLAPALRRGPPTVEDLASVQRRREWPTKMTQWLQLALQKRVIAPTLAAKQAGPPWPLRLLLRLPWFRRQTARLIGIGLRPEHVAD